MLESKEKRTGRILGSHMSPLSNPTCLCLSTPPPLSFPPSFAPCPNSTNCGFCTGWKRPRRDHREQVEVEAYVSAGISLKALPIHSRTMYSKVHLSHGGLWTEFAAPNLEWKEISKRPSKVIYQTVRRSTFKTQVMESQDHPVG